MKIVTWNCHGKFREKYRKIAQLDEDIYVIQECENTPESNLEYIKWGKQFFWHGDGKNRNKGLGIFVGQSIKVEQLNWQNYKSGEEDHELEFFLPLRVNDSFNLVGIWTKAANSPTFEYIGQLWKYLELHKEKMATNTVLCGDLNSNEKWHKWDRWWNHRDVIRELLSVDIISLYHHTNGEAQGAESCPTYYQHRKLEKSYHIDYAFSSKPMFNVESNQVIVGDYNEWHGLSDHMPIIFTVLTGC